MICTLCLRNKSFEFIDLGMQPMANKYPKKGFKDEKFFPLKAFFCPDCKNIQIGKIVSRETMFEDYYYLSSVNKVLVDHYEKYARTLSKAKFVIDVGSGDGISLKPLKEMGVKCLGVDPSINVGKIANGKGLETIVAFFNSKSAKAIVKKYGKADVITGFSMFSHLENQHQFIEDVKTVLTDDGKFVVEVEYNKLVLDTMSFERFYLDRVFYFSVTSFQELFKQHGMYVSDVEITHIHGGSLRVTAQKKGFGKPLAIVKKLIDEEKKSLTPKTVRKFGKEAKRRIEELKDVLVRAKKKGYTVAGYGSPARVSTITNFGDIGPDLIDFIVDDSPLKQGRFSPGKHIPIVSNEYLTKHPKDVILFFAYESFNDIKKKLARKATYLFPIPVRMVK